MKKHNGWELIVLILSTAIKVLVAAFLIPVIIIAMIVHAGIDLLAYTFDKKQANYTNSQVSARAADRRFAFYHRCVDAIENLITSIFKN